MNQLVVISFLFCMAKSTMVSNTDCSIVRSPGEASSLSSSSSSPSTSSEIVSSIEYSKEANSDAEKLSVGGLRAKQAKRRMQPRHLMRVDNHYLPVDTESFYEELAESDPFKGLKAPIPVDRVEDSAVKRPAAPFFKIVEYGGKGDVAESKKPRMTGSPIREHLRTRDPRLLTSSAHHSLEEKIAMFFISIFAAVFQPPTPAHK